MLSLFLGWFLSSMNSACSRENYSNGGLLRRLSSGLLIGVVCTEIVPSMVLELHEVSHSYLLAPIVGIIVSIVVVRGVDMISDSHGDPRSRHKLSLHLVDNDSKSGSYDDDEGGTRMMSVPITHDTPQKSYNGNGTFQKSSEYKPIERHRGGSDTNATADSDAEMCWAALGPALKLLVNCVLDGVVLGTSLVENFDSTGWSLSAAVTLETCVLGMSFSSGTKHNTPYQKLCLNILISSGFPIGVIIGLLVIEEFQFNTFFFLSVLGFTTGLLMDIVLEDLMREAYLAEKQSGEKESKLAQLMSGGLNALAFYLGFTWCLVSEVILP